MSAPRIKVRPLVSWSQGVVGFRWDCTAPFGSHREGGPTGEYQRGWSLAAAADAGRAHLAKHHAPHPTPYSRRCGVSLASCEAQTCLCVSGDPGPEIGAQEAAQLFGDDPFNGELWREDVR